MTYPTENSEIRDAVLGYTPNVAAAQAAYAAALGLKTVPMLVAAFRALRDHAAELDLDGRLVLCGLAHMLNSFNFSNLRPDALAVLQTVPATLPPDPVQDDPVPEDPVPETPATETPA